MRVGLHSAVADGGSLFGMLHRTCSTGPRSPRGLVGRACKALSRVPVRPRCMSLGVGTLSSMVRLADKDDSGTISFEEFAETVSAL